MILWLLLINTHIAFVSQERSDLFEHMKFWCVVDRAS